MYEIAAHMYAYILNILDFYNMPDVIIFCFYCQFLVFWLFAIISTKGYNTI